MSFEKILILGMIAAGLSMLSLGVFSLVDRRQRKRQNMIWQKEMETGVRPHHRIPVSAYGEPTPRFVRHDPAWRPPQGTQRPAAMSGPIGSPPTYHRPYEPSSEPVGGIDPVVGFGLGYAAGALLHSTPEAQAVAPDPTPQVDAGGSCPDTGFASSYDSGGGFDGGGFSGGGE